MRYILIFSGILYVFSNGIFGQNTLLIKPNAERGNDVSICNSPSWSNGNPLNIVNFGESRHLRNISWTAFSNGSPEHDWWSLIKFDTLDQLQSISVLSATLTLYELPDNPWSNGGQFGDNESRLFRPSEAWDELSTTWNSQPDYNQDQFKIIPTNNDYHAISIDVTDWVIDMIETPANNHGFLIRPTDVDHYRSMSFSSSDHEDASLWPELLIEYEDNNEPSADTCQFAFPNVFTPDGNGINDEFRPISNCSESILCTMQIFNRWGQEVFYTNSSTKGWDGNTNGKPAASGVYIYKISISYANQTSYYKGDLTLLR